MESKEEKKGFYSFNTSPFLRTLSYREFLTSISLAFLLLTFNMVVNYYSNEDWVSDNIASFRWISFLILFPVNHIFYKLEHRRPNNFIGRNIHDYIFLLMILLISRIYAFFIGNGVTYQFEGNGAGIVILLFVSVMILEVFIAVLKRLFKFAGWRIF